METKNSMQDKTASNKERRDACNFIAKHPEMEFILNTIFCDSIIFNQFGKFMEASSPDYKKKELVKLAIDYLGWDQLDVIKGYVMSILVSGQSITCVEPIDNEYIKDYMFIHTYGEIDYTKDNNKIVAAKWQTGPFISMSYVESIMRPYNMYILAAHSLLISKIDKKSESLTTNDVEYFYKKLMLLSGLPKSRYIMEPDIEDTKTEKIRYQHIIDHLRNCLKTICLQTIHYIKEINEEYKDIEMTKNDIRFIN